MKDAKLQIPVRGTNRKFYLMEPRPSDNRPDYYVRFDVPRELRARDRSLPRTVLRSTGTSDLKAAKTRGRDIIEAVLELRIDDSERMKRATSSPTIGQLLEAYEPDIRSETARNNKSALRLILREAFDLDNAAKVDELRCDEALSDETLRRWIKIRVRRLKDAGADYLEELTGRHTINQTMAQARSVTSRKVIDLYKELKLPDLAAWRAVPPLDVRGKDVSYKPLSAIALDRIAEDAQRLKRGESEIAAAAKLAPWEQIQVYRGYLLMSRLGLRNSEAEHAKDEWIVRHDDGSADFEIKPRAYFRTKNKHYGTIEIAPDVLAELDEHRGLPDAWIIQAPTKTQRHNLVNDKLNAWLRHFIPDREKCAYELRKHAGSVILSRPESEGGGLVAAARFLRDSIETTERHYASYLKKVRGVSGAELGKVRAA